MKNLIAIIFVSLFLTACGLSPQVVKIDPSLSDAKSAPPSSDITFALVVSDRRDSPIMGTRGGVYKETSVIKTKGDITKKIHEKLVSSFNKANYKVDSSAAMQLDVAINKLTYQGFGENRISEVEVSTEILVTVTRAGGNYTKTYKANRKKEVLKSPSEEKNEEMINDILSTAIQRVLDDNDLLDYIKSNQ
ncbi:MAG: hypothetical protein HND53_09195 [Proteobacteria bacterium]|nr:hypothetical protein [Pseudomonadota bacterium]NOG60661.1 hypothetical protein [Pseudomonadota bacterium]